MVKISKYHGLGNDFIMLNYEDCKELNHSKMALSLCNRNTGIGADGLIIVKQDPLEMIYYNGDGSRAEMCGNGIRCFSKYVYDKGITRLLEYNVSTLAGVMKINVLDVNPFTVEVNMGNVSYKPTDIPVDSKEEVIDKEFIIDNQVTLASSLLMGVPHTVLETKSFSIHNMIKVGRFFEENSFYPKGTNVNFYQILDTNHIKMQTFERGAGLTLACGTGACATFAHLYKQGLVEQSCIVSLPLGDLTIREDNKNIYMSGPAVSVFEGTINEEVFK